MEGGLVPRAQKEAGVSEATVKDGDKHWNRGCVSDNAMYSLKTVGSVIQVVAVKALTAIFHLFPSYLGDEFDDEIEMKLPACT